MAGMRSVRILVSSSLPVMSFSVASGLTAECLSRKYGYRRYTRKETLTDLPAEYTFFNDYDYVMLSQNEQKKDMYDVCFVKNHDYLSGETEEEIMRKYYREIQLDQKEREKFELYLIANPFVEAGEKCFVSREY